MQWGHEEWAIVATIDPIDARDFDDAVSLTQDARSKHWQLAVHIADVGHFAPLGSALDREARLRGTSVYLPQRVLPMFPEIISNSLASLQQGRVRYVKTALIDFTPHGQKTSVRFANGWLNWKPRTNDTASSHNLINPQRGATQMTHDSRILKHEAQIEQLKAKVPEWRS